ncbi:HEAT repeat domain-containing protein [Haloferax larsenii]|uniref:HEAT repeat domain-containing protein n=1 Tax=Haloferax larsenii TaxID=302484 RepID=A0ABY5RBY8_HALLR|nr:HEAT repeat domain-containing protein [Haloferax larsenii]UVE49857.1 HEAT repeat domain-containing protein [Haloferax larsenii]
MEDARQSSSVDSLTSLITAGEYGQVVESLEELEAATPKTRKRTLRTLRSLADEQAGVFDGVVPALTPFLTDAERSVRLTTARLLVTIAESNPNAVVTVAEPVAARLADEDEFYYVRARAAEVLGYVALEYPDKVSSPEVLADLRVGLSFDKSEVKEKLAKAIEYVAVGNPERLRHHVSRLTEHLDDENELVRYHLTTALVAVGTEHPERLSGVTAALAERLGDENAHVRGRAAEALGVLAREGVYEGSSLETTLEAPDGDDDTFADDRVQFALDAVRESETLESDCDEFGTIESVRRTTSEAVDAISSPESDEECPHCGVALPESGPPMCPHCGAPR